MLNICIEHYTVALLNPVPLFLYHDTDAAVQSNQHLLPLAVLVDMPLAGFIGGQVDIAYLKITGLFGGYYPVGYVGKGIIPSEELFLTEYLRHCAAGHKEVHHVDTKILCDALQIGYGH